MDTVTMQSLLKASEGKLRDGLQADAVIDQKQSADRLNSLLEQMLLRYNAAHTDEPARQALAECMSVTARDMLGLLSAISAVKEIEKRKVRTGAVICMLLANPFPRGRLLIVI